MDEDSTGAGSQTSRQWYVLRSKPNKELILWRELMARGFECFYPQLHVRPVNPRSRTVRPYFPGYMFLYLPAEQAAASTLQWMPFSSGFVAFDDVPATVPLHLVEAIRRHVEQINAESGPQGAMAGLKHGDPVTIQGGPFAGYEAIFDTRLSGEERVRVLLKLLNVREMQVDLPVGQLQRKK
jgi:transcription antitermination factor NusG